LLSEDDEEDCQAESGIGAEAIQGNTSWLECLMKRRVQPKRSVHGPRHTTPAGQSVFRDLFPKAEAEELEIRAVLLMGLERWLSTSAMTQTEAAKVLGVTQARISDIRRGKINQFSLDLLVRLAARAGLRPTLKLAA
jgi:predicted XRE-type DNA-binding protein